MDDLGVSEHDGLAVGKRDLVVRRLGAARVVDTKHDVRDYARPGVSGCGAQIAFGLVPHAQLARSTRLHHRWHGQTVGRNAGNDQRQRTGQQHIRPRRQAQPAPHAHRGAMLFLSAPGPHAISSNKNTPLESGAFIQTHS